MQNASGSKCCEEHYSRVKCRVSGAGWRGGYCATRARGGLPGRPHLKRDLKESGGSKVLEEDCSRQKNSKCKGPGVRPESRRGRDTPGWTGRGHPVHKGQRGPLQRRGLAFISNKLLFCPLSPQQQQHRPLTWSVWCLDYYSPPRQLSLCPQDSEVTENRLPPLPQYPC